MVDITLSEELRYKVPGIQLYCIQAGVTVVDTPDELWQLILTQCRQLSEKLKLEEISSLPAIKSSRRAYKLTGKDPARYRLSAEALLRRAASAQRRTTRQCPRPGDDHPQHLGQLIDQLRILLRW